jgi:predicted RNA polymerase sigma factor
VCLPVPGDWRQDTARITRLVVPSFALVVWFRKGLPPNPLVWLFDGGIRSILGELRSNGASSFDEIEKLASNSQAHLEAKLDVTGKNQVYLVVILVYLSPTK